MVFYTDTKPHRSRNSDASDDDKARAMIKKAKVEDDEYKNSAEEQTYYR